MDSNRLDSRRRQAGTARATPPQSADESLLHDRVLQQFRIVFNAIKTHFQQVERKAGIGGAQVWALSLIRDRPDIGVNDLAAALNVRQPTASIIVKNLAQQSLIETRRDGPDRRTVQLRVTPKGRGVLRRAPGPHAGLLPDALKALPPATLRQLERALLELIPLLDADLLAASTPLSNIHAAD